MPGIVDNAFRDDWEGLPAALLQLIGMQLTPSGLAAGREACISWREGLSLGVTTLAPRLHQGRAFADAARWDLLKQVPRLFPLCTGLDLRRCRVKAGSVPVLTQLGLPVTAVRVDLKVSKQKKRQVAKVVNLMAALGATSGDWGPEEGIALEVFVTDKPFWWNNSLTDGDMRRIRHAVPSNVQVRVMDLSMHVIQNLTRKGFEDLAALTSLRQLTLVNSSTISSTGFQALGRLTNLERLHVGCGMPVTDEGLVATIAPLTGLRSLTIVELPLVTSIGIQATFQPALPRLVELGLQSFPGLTDVALRVLGRLTMLTSLDLDNSHQVTDEGLMGLAPLPRLARLNVSSCYQLSVPGIRRYLAAAVSRVHLTKERDEEYDTPWVSPEGCPLFASARKRI